MPYSSNGSTDVLIKQGSLFLGLVAGPIMALLAGGPDDGGATAALAIMLQELRNSTIATDIS